MSYEGLREDSIVREHDHWTNEPRKRKAGDDTEMTVGRVNVGDI